MAGGGVSQWRGGRQWELDRSRGGQTHEEDQHRADHHQNTTETQGMIRIVFLFLTSFTYLTSFIYLTLFIYLSPFIT